jgi:hypothetical protein
MADRPLGHPPDALGMTLSLSGGEQLIRLRERWPDAPRMAPIPEPKRADTPFGVFRLTLLQNAD